MNLGNQLRLVVLNGGSRRSGFVGVAGMVRSRLEVGIELRREQREQWKLIGVVFRGQGVVWFGILLKRLGIRGRLFVGYIFEMALILLVPFLF